MDSLATWFALAANAFLLKVFAGLPGCAVALAPLASTRGPHGVPRIDLPWSNLAWFGAGPDFVVMCAP